MTVGRDATVGQGAATAVWAALAVVTGALAWLAAGSEIDTRPIAPNGEAALRGPLVAATAGPAANRPLSAYRETLDRPLFEPSRRPRPEEPDGPLADDAATPKRSPTADGLRIVGIMTGKGGAAVPRALVRAPEEPQAIWVEAGAIIGGWKVARIGDRTVTLENGPQRHELNLFSDGPLSNGDR